MEPLGLSQNALARAVRVPPRRINELVHGRRAVTADTDLRLTRYFGLSEGFFLGLQADHDLLAQRSPARRRACRDRAARRLRCRSHARANIAASTATTASASSSPMAPIRRTSLARSTARS